MTNTIPNVPRELKPCPFCGDIPSENSHALTDGGFKYGAIQCGCGALGPDVRTEYKDWPHWRDAAFAAWNERALLSAPSPAGVDGLEVVAWLSSETVEAVIPGAGYELLLLEGRNLEPLCRLSDATAIIDGLRGENEALHDQVKVLQSDANSWQSGYDEGRRMGGKHCALTIYQHAQRVGELEGLLRSIKGKLSGRANIHDRIDAALSAGKEGE